MIRTIFVFVNFCPKFSYTSLQKCNVFNFCFFFSFRMPWPQRFVCNIFFIFIFFDEVSKWNVFVVNTLILFFM